MRALAIVVLLLAGCMGDPGPESGDPLGTPPVVPALPPGVPLADQTWVASQCEIASAVMTVDRMSVAQHLPAGYAPADAATATVALFIADCPTITTSNSTLVGPTQITFVEVPVRAKTNETDAVETYLLEVVVSDDALGAALREGGYPARPGNLSMTPIAAGRSLLLEGADLRYQVDAPALAGDADGVPLSRLYLHHHGPADGGHLIRQAYQEATAFQMPQAAILTAEGGILGEMLAGGAWPALLVLATATSVLEFQ